MKWLNMGLLKDITSWSQIELWQNSLDTGIYYAIKWGEREREQERRNVPRASPHRLPMYCQHQGLESKPLTYISTASIKQRQQW